MHKHTVYREEIILQRALIYFYMTSTMLKKYIILCTLKLWLVLFTTRDGRVVWLTTHTHAMMNTTRSTNTPINSRIIWYNLLYVYVLLLEKGYAMYFKLWCFIAVNHSINYWEQFYLNSNNKIVAINSSNETSALAKFLSAKNRHFDAHCMLIALQRKKNSIYLAMSVVA